MRPSLVKTATQGKEVAAARIGEAKVTIPWRGSLEEIRALAGGP
jgi:hypothetical protein